MPAMLRNPWFELRAIWPPLLLAALALFLSAMAASLGGQPLLLAPGLAAAAILLLDARARLIEHRGLRRLVREAGGLKAGALDRFRALRRTWCTRTAALSAASAEGFAREAQRQVRAWGYRAWHVFPDRAFSRRSPFLRMSFWKSIVGGR